jgi:hypothetical protein
VPPPQPGTKVRATIAVTATWMSGCFRRMCTQDMVPQLAASCYCAVRSASAVYSSDHEGLDARVRLASCVVLRQLIAGKERRTARRFCRSAGAVRGFGPRQRDSSAGRKEWGRADRRCGRNLPTTCW